MSKLRNILLIEDSQASRDLMREAFKAASYDGKLHMAENGAEAMAFLQSEKNNQNTNALDLILLDLNLPGLTGLEVLAQIKSDSHYSPIPLVVLTGSNAASDIQACSKFGCRYLLKPSRFHELVDLVKSLPEFC